MNQSKFAWIISPKTIKVHLTNSSEVHTSRIHLTDHRGNTIPLATSKQNHKELYVYIDQLHELDFKKNYIVEIDHKKQYCYYSLSAINTYFHYQGYLGPKYNDDSVELFVWSPPATKLKALFFSPDNKEKPVIKKSLQRKKHGIWYLKISNQELKVQSAHGLYYQLEVTAYGKTKLGLDPYAKSMEAFSPSKTPHPKAAIIDPVQVEIEGFTSSKKTNAQLIKSPQEFIGYEVHIRDFTIDPTCEISSELKGTYLGAAQNIDHLKELGITHVQLLPIHSCFTKDETNKSLQDSAVPTNKINYNWGYDTQHYFIPEGWFVVDVENPASRLTELKQMIKQFHDSNIGIIMDVVYNHIYHEAFLENIAPGCYLRMDDHGKISGTTGAGPSLESRNKMTRRLIIDSLKYFQEEFHINGFRFDLMGFLDHQTMIEIREALGEDAILYGEGWDFTDLPKKEATTKYHYPQDIQLGFFNDTTRNSFTGEMEKQGFVQGNFFEAPKVKSGIIGGIKHYPTDYDDDGHLDVFIDQYSYHCFADMPVNTINYLTIHDGYTLWDKLNLSIDADAQERKKLARLALAMLFTSQGRIVLHGGDEIGRSKPLSSNDPNKHRAHTRSHIHPENSVRYFHENSYKSPDITNMFNWKRARGFKDLFSYVKGLIALRKEMAGLRYKTAESIKNGLRFTAEYIPNAPQFAIRPDTRHRCWSKLESLTIDFVNGPPNTRLYIIGEIHGDRTHSKNPVENPYYVDLDIDGNGQYTFSLEQIKNFDLSAWGDKDSLDFKLVLSPGEWKYPEGLYSKFGNNKITPCSIIKGKNRALIDLSIKDHVAGRQDIYHHGHIAYLVDNKLEEENSAYDKLLVIHNANTKFIELKIPQISDFKQMDILVDNLKSGTTPLDFTSVQILKKQNRVKIPGRTTVVIGCN